MSQTLQAVCAGRPRRIAAHRPRFQTAELRRDESVIERQPYLGQHSWPVEPQPTYPSGHDHDGVANATRAVSNTKRRIDFFTLTSFAARSRIRARITPGADETRLVYRWDMLGKFTVAHPARDWCEIPHIEREFPIFEPGW